MHKFIFPLLLLISICGFTQNTTGKHKFAQNKKSVVVKDSTKVRKNHELNPLTSSLLSTFIPGAGQIYNRKYWKAPIVWGGALAFYYSYDFFSKQHEFWHQILIYKDRYNSNEYIIPFVEKYERGFTNLSAKEVSELPKDEIQSYNDFAKTRKHQVIIGASVFYLFQIVDATVDAHFSEFDVSENLSLKLAPATFQNTPYAQGVKLSFSF